MLALFVTIMLMANLEAKARLGYLPKDELIEEVGGLDLTNLASHSRHNRQFLHVLVNREMLSANSAG